MLRFDDRLYPTENVGDDFQKFASEALRSQHFDQLLAGRYVRPYFAFGNDGGIDHLAVSDRDQIVIECKFFGKDRKGHPAKDWIAVKKKLGPNLRANTGHDINSVSHHYRPWFDPRLPIKGYWFCTSGVFQPGAQTKLKQDIKAFFVSLAKSHHSVAHLADIDIEVLGWNDFDGALDATPPLRFRWFRQLPNGFRTIQSLTEGKTFRRFLDEGTLEFYSRDAFNRENGLNNQTRLTDEQSILLTLLEDNDQTGLVLAGPGGLGKTRLALQFGIEAERCNWLVLQVERNALPEAIDELARFYGTSAGVLLAIDYAEAAASLFGLVQAIQRANREGEHRFRLVATCRTSALSAVKEALGDSACRTLEFSGRADDQYNNWVVNKILGSVKVPRLEEISLVCRGIPALAAFAVFLFKQHPKNFNDQFGQIHHGDDFAVWANRRLKLALSAQGFDEIATRRSLATLAARLPLQADEYHILRGDNAETARLLDLLQADRWIESDGIGVAAAHDIFADAIIARYVFEAPATITDRAGDVLSDAMDAGAFDRAIVALNRLAAHKRFSEIDGLAAIRRVYARNAVAVLAAHKVLLQTRLPNHQTTIRLIDSLPDFASSLAIDISCDGPLAYLAESVAESNDAVWRNEAGQILQPLLDRAVERTGWSNIVVRRALRLLPARYRQQAINWVRAQPTRLETHYLLVAWLKSGLPLDEITSDLETWLIHGGRIDPKASFVFSAWLDEAAKLHQPACSETIGKIEPHLLAWLGEHATAEAAQFVYEAWLDAAVKLDQSTCFEKIDKVEPHVLAWLGEHAATEVAQFVYEAWLDAAAKLDQSTCLEMISKFEPRILAWFGKHATTAAARFVYEAWLDAAAKLDQPACLEKIGKVEPHVLAWLGEHEITNAAQFVYRAWLHAATNLSQSSCLEKVGEVERYLFAWFGEHETIEDAHFVYSAWLDAAASLSQSACLENIGKVEPHVLAWLGRHSKAEQAQFVCRAWLDAGGSIDLIRSSMFEWFNENPDYDESDYIIKAWLEATGDFRSVRTAALRWFKRNKTESHAVYILKYIVKERELPPDTVEDIIAWCTTFPGNLDSICRIWPIYSRFAVDALEEPLIKTTLLVLEHVNTQWMTDKGVRNATLATIGSLAGKHLLSPGIEPRLDALHANVLLNSQIYSTDSAADIPSFVHNPALAQHVAGMIERKVIDPVTHASALQRFADWLDAWPLEAKQMMRRESVDSDEPNLDQVLDELSDIQIPPHRWSNLWQRCGWERFPGEPRLVALARRWLFEAAPHPSWPFVWEPLFLYFPEDQEFVSTALWWLEHRGPRDRGAWAFVWKSLWDHAHARDHLVALAHAWLQEYEGKHKSWTEVRSRLDAMH